MDNCRSSVYLSRWQQGNLLVDVLSCEEAIKAIEDEDDLDVLVDSPAIRRLIEEVRTEETGVPRSYNRTFNRHNR